MPKHFKYLVFIAFISSACIFEIDKTPKEISPGVVFRTMATLPSAIPESSGIETGGDHVLYSMNDSKGNATLYAFDTTGTLLRRIKIDNARNADWEDLAQDAEGNIYIGDFGNNNNKRTDLRIYRIPSPDSFAENEVVADTINFAYEDQTAFPPHDTAFFYDCESSFIFNDSIFLFIKDRAKHSEGKTVMYSIPARPGTHTALLRGEFSTFKSKPKGAVTAADISPDGSKMVMISERNVWVFTDFEGSDFFGGKVKLIELPVKYQMEGVVFVNECLLYLTSEKSAGDFAALHRLSICGL